MGVTKVHTAVWNTICTRRFEKKLPIGIEKIESIGIAKIMSITIEKIIPIQLLYVTI